MNAEEGCPVPSALQDTLTECFCKAHGWLIWNAAAAAVNNYGLAKFGEDEHIVTILMRYRPEANRNPATSFEVLDAHIVALDTMSQKDQNAIRPCMAWHRVDRVQRYGEAYPTLFVPAVTVFTIEGFPSSLHIDSWGIQRSGADTVVRPECWIEALVATKDVTFRARVLGVKVEPGLYKKKGSNWEWEPIRSGEESDLVKKDMTRYLNLEVFNRSQRSEDRSVAGVERFRDDIPQLAAARDFWDYVERAKREGRITVINL